METSHSDESTGESNAKRLKIETEGSTTSKPVAKDPFLSLPSDVLSKIIGYIPVAQWPALESLDNNFRSATLLAWRNLRSINVDRELLVKSGYQWSIQETVVQSCLQKLAERSPFLTSLSGIDIQLVKPDSDEICPLAQFEHLQSIRLGDAKFFGSMSLEAVVKFLETTRSRTTLEELQLLNVTHGWDPDAFLDRFAASFVNGQEIQSPLKLKKFVFASSPWYPWIRLDTLDAPWIRLDTLDATRLTDVRVAKTPIEPHHLTNLIERASNLHRIELAFLHCDDDCNGPRLESNKKLLAALSSLENLTALKFGRFSACDDDCNCMDIGPEFIRMLQMIGRRGQLRKLSMERFVLPSSAIDMNEVCATIRHYIPYLQSIKLYVDGISDGSMSELLSLAALEEIYFVDSYNQPMTANARKIAQLPHLKRLAFDVLSVDTRRLKHLADSNSLMDLRMQCFRYSCVDVLVKWSEGFAANLQILMLLGIADNDAYGLVRLLEKAVRLRVLRLKGHITNRSLMAIANSCSELEIFGVQSTSNGISVQHLQMIVDRCPKLKRLGGIGDEIRKKLQFPKYRKISDVDIEFWNYDFDDDEYN